MHRVERGHRLLEDHADAAAAHLAHLVGGSAQVVAVEQDRPPSTTPARLRQQPHDRERGHRLAAARFADEAERLARCKLEADTVDDALVAALRVGIRSLSSSILRIGSVTGQSTRQVSSTMSIGGNVRPDARASSVGGFFFLVDPKHAETYGLEHTAITRLANHAHAVPLGQLQPAPEGLANVGRRVQRQERLLVRMICWI